MQMEKDTIKALLKFASHQEFRSGFLLWNTNPFIYINLISDTKLKFQMKLHHKK
jgi:hypothetical protein